LKNSLTNDFFIWMNTAVVEQTVSQNCSAPVLYMYMEEKTISFSMFNLGSLYLNSIQ
jgi:hypothetical protein